MMKSSPIKERDIIESSMLGELERSYSIQIDTPQHSCAPSPRLSMNPQDMFIENRLEGRPVQTPEWIHSRPASSLAGIRDYRPSSVRPMAQPDGSTSTASDTSAIKRQKERWQPPEKSSDTITPEAKPAATYSKPAREFRTPKTPRIKVAHSPTPVRKLLGCWACHCRRKKCDLGFPVGDDGYHACSMCIKLDIPCLGLTRERPDWSTPQRTGVVPKQEDLKRPRYLDMNLIEVPKLDLFESQGIENDA